MDFYTENLRGLDVPVSRLLLNLKLGVPLESCVILVPMFSILKRAFSILESPRRLSSIETRVSV